MTKYNAMTDEQIERQVADNVYAFKRFEYLIGLTDIDGKIITKLRLVRWAYSKEKKLVCVYCSHNYPYTDMPNCKPCGEYNGIIPDFEGIE